MSEEVNADAALVARAQAGDGEARSALVARATLKGARAIIGTAKDRDDLLRAIVRADGAAPQLGVLLAAIAGDPDVKGAAERVRRAGADRWGPAERLAIARFAAACGARLGAEEQLELLEWIGKRGDEEASALIAAAAAAALDDASPELLERLARRDGFEQLVLRGDPLVLRWIREPEAARAVATALLSAHARDKANVVAVLDAIWDASGGEDTWTDALGDAIARNTGMSGRDEIADWGWARFCEHPEDRSALYAAFRPWRHEWKERRDAMPGDARPGGASAVEHLRLWGGLDVEHLTDAIEEAVRLAGDRDWAALVELAFDLAARAPADLRRHALAGACKMAHEVTNRARDAEITDGIATGAALLEARATALAASLRASGAVLDPIVANRAEDLDTDLRLIREARERRAERVRRDDEQREREAQRIAQQRELERQRVEAERMRAEQEERAAAARAEAQAALAGMSAGGAASGASYSWTAPRPGDDALLIDREVLFPSLPCPTLLAYARMFKRLTQAPDGVQSLAAEGVSLQMLAVINESWASAFQRRTELAIRFSSLLSAPWV